MVTISFFFLTLVVLFGIIGAMRGWAKEMLVSFSLVMALFVMQVVMSHIGPMKNFFETTEGASTQFYVSSLIIILFALSGYHTPNAQRINKNLSRDNKSAARHWLQDMMLGGILGIVNGYLLVGTLWHYLNLYRYPVSRSLMAPPELVTPVDTMALKMIEFLPPVWLDVPVIYFAVAVIVTFVVIVLV
jgi:hypothetical protein